MIRSLRLDQQRLLATCLVRRYFDDDEVAEAVIGSARLEILETFADDAAMSDLIRQFDGDLQGRPPWLATVEGSLSLIESLSLDFLVECLVVTLHAEVLRGGWKNEMARALVGLVQTIIERAEDGNE